MYKKVLVAEDLDTISLTVKQALESIDILNIDVAKYCDDAFLKIKKGITDNTPYELLITDLSFKKDCRETNLHSGEDLIEAVKKIQPDIKTIVFSIEDKSYLISKLHTQLKIDAYVMKGRNSIENLKQTVHKLYLQKEIKVTLAKGSIGLIEIDQYDVSLLKLLANGLSIQEISGEFSRQNCIPNSTSSIEKKINKLKIYFKATNNVHLIALTKDLGII
ncbi:response regulator [Flavobacterium sp. TMP13]|uniref:response regulator n=1 Tax=Flavobacterium sp. TMP13 TaxID=3425950 RepID=UPI003D783411